MKKKKTSSLPFFHFYQRLHYDQNSFRHLSFSVSLSLFLSLSLSLSNFDNFYKKLKLRGLFSLIPLMSLQSREHRALRSFSSRPSRKIFRSVSSSRDIVQNCKIIWCVQPGLITNSPHRQHRVTVRTNVTECKELLIIFTRNRVTGARYAIWRKCNTLNKDTAYTYDVSKL
jgi:hypothetical protein